MSLFKRSVAMVLCSLLTGLPAMAQPGGNNQVAGQINALIPAATRNSQTAKVKEELNWNDLLKTEKTGRVRAGLKDGSILSVGSDSELRIVQHDTVSQQTELEMDFGKVRSQVTKVTKAGGKFEMKTPNAVIGVIGTDFYTSFEGNKTIVICYKGQVTVTPVGNAVAAGLFQCRHGFGRSDGGSHIGCASCGPFSNSFGCVGSEFGSHCSGSRSYASPWTSGAQCADRFRTCPGIGTRLVLRHSRWRRQWHLQARQS